MTWRTLVLVPISVPWNTGSHRWLHRVMKKFKIYLAFHSALTLFCITGAQMLSFSLWESGTSTNNFFSVHMIFSNHYSVNSSLKLQARSLDSTLFAVRDWSRRNLYAFQDISSAIGLQDSTTQALRTTGTSNAYSFICKKNWKGSFIFLSDLCSPG